MAKKVTAKKKPARVKEKEIEKEIEEEQEPAPAQAADQIGVGNVAEGGAVAAGRGARAYSFKVGNVTLDLRLLPVVVVLVAVIGVLGYFLLRPTHPEKMTGGFNVAIAGFTVVDESGSAVKSDEGSKLSKFIYDRLSAGFAELDLKTVRYELWPPDFTGQIKGKTKEERFVAAEALAGRIDAHVIIYGVVTLAGENSSFAPEFYVNYKGFEQAEEITGQHEMGNPVLVNLPFVAEAIQDVENPAFSARANALSLITIGLAYYSVDDYAEALNYFTQAEATKGWLKNAGKEIVYLLMGNATARQASKDKNSGSLTKAHEFYETALSVNGEYASARVGLAGVLYLIALGDP
ncbi:MAG: hypothetical protein AAB427_14920, partial [Chloroflexota bacterium]